MKALSRRTFLRLAGAAGLAGVLPRDLWASDDHVTISILHTTDLHGHVMPTSTYEGVADVGGLARCASRIAAWRNENPHHLVLDCGDVYQGTEVGLRTRGALMIDCFNALGYDAWVVGNHEFDWGSEPFAAAVQRSKMPVLCSNVNVSSGAGLDRIAPWLVREIAGIRIGVIGVTTPGLPYWLRPESLKGFTVGDPVQGVRKAVAACRAKKVDAIVLVVHMGTRPQGDDFANQVDALTRAFPDAAVCLAGHTHREHPGVEINGVLYTQANYYGIHAGRVDLTFDRGTRRLVDRKARLDRMDASAPFSPEVLALATRDVELSERVMAEVVCELARPLSVRTAPGSPSEVEELIGAAISEAMRRKGLTVDGVLHGLFEEKIDLAAGPKTVRDVWKVLPYENYVVTAEFTPAQLREMIEPIVSQGLGRNLMGFRVEVEGVSGTGSRARGVLKRILTADGRELNAGKRYRIAMNSYDAQSGGQRMMALRVLLERPEARATLQDVQTREALLTYLTEQKTIG
jgi:2',3'-cyclic-nucleotide 2'-phosphodiesterase/3'-nucleotidase